ncbi:DnaJ domain-containing protein [Halomicrobium zhouii]|uniref:DnaJ domain-containing protein n=1 Tax=Halomicrobium zhouii TaxID=767519 RepID=A0A1I6LHN1_9EURY|nr:J domain-containing protein [Halomicrobium zhouii]SFS02873.1 DnaJ domain-containing protein [Halomicrobium zhouii]
MLAELGPFPEWLLVGTLLGVLGSVVVAGLFLVANRLYPTPTATSDGRGDGEGRRRDELRAYLQAIDESYAEDHFVEGQHVAFYLPERDVAITFDARAFYRIERSPTTPVLVEHEMPGVQLGARLPFETPEVEFGTQVERDQVHPATAAFRELGLPAGATLEEVKRAYRRRVKEVHPDRGGDEDAFKRVREAYTTAKRHAAD